MVYNSKRHLKRVSILFGIGVLILILTINTPFSIPCIWKMIFNIQCPSCGLSRAFILASQFRFIEAIKMNILFLPLVVGGAVYLVCAIIDVLANRQTIEQFNAILSKKWVRIIIFALIVISWGYNIIRGI